MNRPASLNPESRTYQRLAHRIAASSLRAALEALRCCGTVADLHEAAIAVSAIVARRNAAKGAE
jgi:hypothetical protein